uniref:Doublecortin domain-containing protein n=1 Tax=Setaria digitata TaxID=48799 RepID=A0A915PW24_9BILA
MDASDLDFNTFATHSEQSVDLDYRGIRIRVYKNGDQYDTGTTIVICRKRFKHWLIFLDFLTKKLDLMAPVHEFYRTDGLRIQHFEEIENGGSYVAVSQGPFLHKPYGLQPEEREKWNINPKIESPEQSTLDSAESVDIYLKQRGYTSRTGLPFPFDGGVCVNHSLMDAGRSRSPSFQSTRRNRTEQKSERKNSKSDALVGKDDTKPDSPRSMMREHEELKPQVSSSSTLCNIESPKHIPEVKSNTSLCQTITIDNQSTEQNHGTGNCSTAEVASASSNKIEENTSYGEIAAENDQKLTVKKSDESVPSPVVQMPDSSREFSIFQQAEKTESLGTVQTANLNYYPLPTKNPETIITIVNDDATIRAGNSSVIIVNISTGQSKRDMSTVSKSGHNAETIQSTASVNNMEVSEEPSSEKAVVKTLPDVAGTLSRTIATTTDTRTSMATPDCAPSVAITTIGDRLSTGIKNQVSRMASPKKNEEDERIAKNVSFKGNSEEQRNNFLGKSGKCHDEIVEQQERNPEDDQNKKQVLNTLKNDAESNEVPNNLDATAPLTIERHEFQKSFGNEENECADESRSSHISLVSGDKYRIQKKQSKRNEDIGRESLTINNSLRDRKRVTLTTPADTSVPDINTDVKLVKESGEAEDLKNGTVEQLKSPQQNISALKTSFTPTAALITHTSGSTDDINDAVASRDANFQVATRKTKDPKLQQSGAESSFEADFTPRHNDKQKNLIRMKTSQRGIDLNLNLRIRRLPREANYDPDFKDYDFI